MEPFKESGVPVLVFQHQVDEMLFQQIGTFKQYNFVNVESGYEEIARDLGNKQTTDETGEKVPEEDITPFCLWLKEHTKPFVGKVTLSKRLKGNTPCVLFGQVSANMRMMMHMMSHEQAGADPQEMAKKLE